VEKCPKTASELLLRTDFSDDFAWVTPSESVQQPNEEGFEALGNCVSDPAYDGLTVEQLVAMCPEGGDRATFARAVRIPSTDVGLPIDWR
jgi:hypothetical protein